jgi:hypothetical protein
MFPSMLPLSLKIIVHLNKRLCGLKLLTVDCLGDYFVDSIGGFQSYSIT